MLRIACVLLIAACVAVFAVVPSSAVADESPLQHGAVLTVAPVIMDVQAEAGQTVKRDLIVTASGDQPLDVTFVHNDFGFVNDTYERTLIPDNAKETTSFSTRGWFSIPKAEYHVPAGTTVTIPLSIKVPDNTPGGTYLGAAFLLNKPPKPTGGTQVVSAVAAGPLIFVGVAGGKPPRAHLKRFEVPRLISKGPIRPKLTIENTGDQWFAYSADVSLKGPGKDDNFDVQRQYVVPGQPRSVRASADAKAGDGRPVVGSSKMGFGKYEVTTEVRIDPTGKQLVTSRTVWLIPMWMRYGVIVALVALVLGGYGAVRGARTLRRRMRARAWERARVRAATPARETTPDVAAAVADELEDGDAHDSLEAELEAAVIAELDEEDASEDEDAAFDEELVEEFIDDEDDDELDAFVDVDDDLDVDLGGDEHSDGPYEDDFVS